MLLSVYGEDVLRVREFADDFVEKFVQKYDPACMNVDQFSFGKVDDEMIWQATQAAPFLAEKRFVVVRDAMGMKKEHAERWIEAVKRISEATILLFVDAMTDEGFEKAQFVKLLKKEGVEIKTYPITSLSLHDRISWIVARTQKAGGKISLATAQVLSVRVGEDSMRLDQEIRKLVAYAQSEEITGEMIAKLTTGVVEGDVFGFTDAVSSSRSHVAAEKFLQELFAGSDAFQLLAMLTRQARLLVQANAMVQQGVKDQGQIAKALDVHPFVASKLLQAIRVFDAQNMIKILEIAIKADADAKRGLHAEVACIRLLAGFAQARKA